MSGNKGFTLIEIITVLVIVGILATVVISSSTARITQQAANAAEHNLIAIYNAEKNYYFNNGSYCLFVCGPTTSAVNSNLHLNITDNYFNYQCELLGSSQFCQATSSSLNLTLTLELQNGAAIFPICLPGATNCLLGTLNPACTSGSPCPTN